MSQSKGKRIVVWVLQILLAVMFVFFSSGKLMGRPEVVEMFQGWGFPNGFHLLIGALELLGAIGLLIPSTAGWAALGLIGVMLGAAGTHLMANEWLHVLPPSVFLAVLTGVVWLRWPLWKGSTGKG